MILFLTIGIAAGFVVHAILRAPKLQNSLPTQAMKKHFPIAVQTVVLVAQAGELVNVVEHVSLVNIIAVLLLLTMVLATRSGTENVLD